MTFAVHFSICVKLLYLYHLRDVSLENLLEEAILHQKVRKVGCFNDWVCVLSSPERYPMYPRFDDSSNPNAQWARHGIVATGGNNKNNNNSIQS